MGIAVSKNKKNNEVITCVMEHHRHQYRSPLYKYSEEELKCFSLDYLIQNAGATELLYAWHKLPDEYRGDFHLQTHLPCFVHYNRPDWETHVDGPPTSQANCYLCKATL